MPLSPILSECTTITVAFIPDTFGVSSPDLCLYPRYFRSMRYCHKPLSPILSENPYQPKSLYPRYFRRRESRKMPLSPILSEYNSSFSAFIPDTFGVADVEYKPLSPILSEWGIPF